ncbi:MAG: hypothetical protein WBA45_15110 [Microthrixaceae bacterium]
MRRLVLVVLGFILVVVPTACRMRADVLIDVDPDGAGEVTVSVVLDRDAAAKLGDPKEAVKVDDLRAAGWKVAEPVTGRDSGDVTLKAVRSFASPGELEAVLTEIGGHSADTPGIFSNVKLDLGNGFASTEYRLRADVELSGSLEQFSDPALKEALGGLALGRTPDQLKTERGTGDSATLSVTVGLPGGKVTSNGTSVGDRVRWNFPIDSGKPTSKNLTATATDSQPGVLVLIGSGVALVVIALALAGVALRRARR